MSNNNVLIKKFESQIKSNENMIENIKKTIKGYGFGNCKTRRDFEFQKLKFDLELEDIKEDIIKAGFKYDSALVMALKNKEGIIKTKINDINDILVLFDKINDLKNEISNLEKQIKKLGGQINPIYNEREQMNIVLNALRNNSSREDAAKLAGIELKRIVNWIHEGRNRTNENKIYFYKQYTRIESNKNRKINRLLKHLKNGKTKSQACELSNVTHIEFNTWYNYGKSGCDKINIDFYKKVKDIQKANEEKIWDNFLDNHHKSGKLNHCFKNAGVI